MNKTYFVKYSYVDPNQPLLRIHDNTEFDIEITPNLSYYDFVDALKESNRALRHEIVVIDFMMEMPTL